MRLEHYSIEQLRSEIRTIVGRHLDLAQYHVFFFGSRVAGGGTDRSDIDVGIQGPKAVPPRAMAEIEDAVDALPTLYKIDIVDFSHVSEKFRTVASAHREFLVPL